MVGPGPGAQGGVASVIGVYRDAGLFASGEVLLLESFSAGSRLAKLGVALAAFVRYAGLLARGRGTVLHAHVSSHASFWRKAVFIWMARLAGRRIVFHLHGGGFRGFIEALGPRRRALALRTIRCSDVLLCLASPVARWLAEVAPGVPVRWWPNPVPAELFSAAPPAAHRAPVLLYLGALLPAKGLLDLLQAFVVLHRHDPAARLLLGGSGPQADALRAAAAAAGVGEAVELLGWVGGGDKLALLRRARVLVLASHLEAQPMVLLEAMAAGTPVLSTRVGGIPDLVEEGVDGLLVDAHNPQQLALGLLRLWDDAGLRERLAYAARARILAQHCAPDACEALRELYRALATR